jgi:hypothetical protein
MSAQALNELSAFGIGYIPTLKAMTGQGSTDPAEALQAIIAGAGAEQKTEDAVNAAASPVTDTARDDGTMEMEAAVDHALAVARALQGRFKASSDDSRARRDILAILRGE